MTKEEVAKVIAGYNETRLVTNNACRNFGLTYESSMMLSVSTSLKMKEKMWASSFIWYQKNRTFSIQLGLLCHTAIVYSLVDRNNTLTLEPREWIEDVLLSQTAKNNNIDIGNQ